MQRTPASANSIRALGVRFDRAVSLRPASRRADSLIEFEHARVAPSEIGPWPCPASGRESFLERTPESATPIASCEQARNRRRFIIVCTARPPLAEFLKLGFMKSALSVCLRKWVGESSILAARARTLWLRRIGARLLRLLEFAHLRLQLLLKLIHLLPVNLALF